VRFIQDACKQIGRYLLMGVALHEAVAFSVQGTFQRAKEGGGLSSGCLWWDVCGSIETMTLPFLLKNS
jgi:hypothetical protein